MWGGFFKSSQKRSAAEFCDLLSNALMQWRDATEAKMKKRAREEASEYVLSIKSMLFGDALQQADTDELLRRARQADLLMTLVSSLPVLEFEARKDAVQIFNNLLRRGLGEEPHNADMRRDVLEKLVQGYEDSDIALNCGSMLRECIRYEKLTALLLNSPKFWTFFDLVELSDFDVASDAFASFKEMLTRHVSVTAAFIEKEQDQFVASYNGLLRSANYVTRRQSLKLLGEMLLERANFNIMTTYIASATNLRLVMNLLLDQRKNIQFEAFHVFKIFVANPNKTPDVKQILIRNKDKLLAYLTDFLNDRVDDSFQEDRNLILEEIRKL